MHVRIDVLSTRLPKPVQHLANIVAYLFCFIPAMWLLGDAAIRRAYSAAATHEVELMSAWGPVVWPFFAALALGCVAMTLQSSVETIRHAIGVFADRKPRAADPRVDPLADQGA